jgi:hypothetical protein
MSMQADITVTNLNGYSREELAEVIAEQLEAVARRLRAGQGSAQITAELFDNAPADEVQVIVSVPFLTAADMEPA